MKRFILFLAILAITFSGTATAFDKGEWKAQQKEAKASLKESRKQLEAEFKRGAIDREQYEHVLESLEQMEELSDSQWKQTGEALAELQAQMESRQ